MAQCNDCRDSILNGQKSLLGDPSCEDNCPSETDCEGIQTYSDCVAVNPALPCIDTDANTSLSDVLVAIDNKLCDTNGCNTWTELTKGNLGLASGWLYAGSGFERPAVSDVKNCIVRLAGTIKRSSFASAGAITIGILPVGKRPLNYRRFSVNFTTTMAYPLNIVASILTIAPTGEMTINNPYSLSVISNPTVSFDGISFETNTII